MKELAIHLRAMQLFTQHAHNLCAHVPFLQDHEFFGSTYESLDNDYDSVVERMVGLMGEKDLELKSLLTSILSKLKDAPSINVKENSTFFSYLLEMEVELCKLVKLNINQSSPGTEQLIGEIANQSEVRQYKIKQRIKK